MKKIYEAIICIASGWVLLFHGSALYGFFPKWDAEAVIRSFFLVFIGIQILLYIANIKMVFDEIKTLKKEKLTIFRFFRLLIGGIYILYTTFLISFV